LGAARRILTSYRTRIGTLTGRTSHRTWASNASKITGAISVFKTTRRTLRFNGTSGGTTVTITTITIIAVFACLKNTIATNR